MNIIMIIPTGIGCAIGGHAGDATPAAKLLGSVCDKIILHPNVVNASDVNEQPANALYVEGSILDRFLEGKIELEEVKQNKILVVANKPITPYVVNGISSTRATLGIDVKIVGLDEPLRMIGKINEEGKASGEVYGVDALVKQVRNYDFDVLAITTLIEVADEVSLYYYKNGGINPWGGVEAMASKMIARKLKKPVAHAPIQSESDKELDRNEGFAFVCDPRIAPELISTCYVHCVLKGLHKAPRISRHHPGMGMGLSVNDIDVMVSPICWGEPHNSCENANIPVIYVQENTTVTKFSVELAKQRGIVVKNYFEAAGVIAAMKSGITLESIRRPLKPTEIING